MPENARCPWCESRDWSQEGDEILIRVHNLNVRIHRGCHAPWRAAGQGRVSTTGLDMLSMARQDGYEP